MDLKKLLPTLAVIYTTSLSSLVISDQISLKNGDRLEGSLISKTDTYVIWQSDNFGEVKIPADQVVLIDQPNKKPATPANIIEKELFKGTVGLSGAYLSGNEQRDDLELDIGLIFEKSDVTHKAKVNYETLGQDNKSTIKDYGVAYGIDWLINNSWYWGNDIFYGADDKRQIDKSMSVGTNMGYQFWNNETSSLSSEIGLTWIKDELINSITDDRLTWAWSGDYEKILIRNVFLAYSHQVYVSIKDSDNAQIDADIGIIIPVSDKLDTKISWDWSFDNQPQEGNEKVDRKLKFGINYSL
jgi:putative salt-induced outer membrane protein YdiY